MRKKNNNNNNNHIFNIKWELASMSRVTDLTKVPLYINTVGGNKYYAYYT